MKFLSNRMGEYEQRGKVHLCSELPTLVRLSCPRLRGIGFDKETAHTLNEAASRAVGGISNFKLGYVADGQATFLFYGDWLGGAGERIAGRLSSLLSVYFNKSYYGSLGGIFAFEGIALNIGMEDAPNYFVWRQREWINKSIELYARKYFDTRGLTPKDMGQRLHIEGKSWDLLGNLWKYGSFITTGGDLMHSREDYWTISTYLGNLNGTV